MSPALRARLPALAVAGVLNALFAWLLIDALPFAHAPRQGQSAHSETIITLSPLPPVLPPKKRLRRPAGAAAGSTAITTPYFNPDGFHLAPPAQNNAIIVAALAACDPGRYDMASVEVRQVCDRIGLALKNDPEHFGVKQDIADPVHWRRELARREAPFLAPCMSPNGFDVLYTLSCLYENVFVGYKPEHRRRYSE
jgi:hypothetical protein